MAAASNEDKPNNKVKIDMFCVLSVLAVASVLLSSVADAAKQDCSGEWLAQTGSAVR
jgi:hypothetical protein